MMLTRDAILAARTLPREIVATPEWGGEVMVQGLSARGRDAFEAAIVEIRGQKRIFHLEDLRARLVALTVVDEAGQALFSEADIRELGQLSAVPIQRIFDVAQRLSGLTQTDIDELSKN